MQALPNAWRRVKTAEQQTARVSRRIRAVGRRAVTTAPPDPVESAFAQTLPLVRARTDADLKKSGLPCEKVLAAVVQLLEQTLIRVGNEEYARQNRSNAYLRQISGEDFSAKDFRTWAGTVLAAKALAATRTFASNKEAKRNIVRAIELVAKRQCAAQRRRSSRCRNTAKAAAAPKESTVRFRAGCLKGRRDLFSYNAAT